MAKRMTLKRAVEESAQYRLRMFKSDFLERYSHVHPAIPFYLYIPIVLGAIVLSFTWQALAIKVFLMRYVLGLFMWTLVEYFLHRFIFHPPMTNKFFKAVYYYSHGVHHDALNDATRLVMPPGASIPLAIAIYFATRAVFPMSFLPLFAGIITGYLIYDFLHFASHFFNFKMGWFKIIKKNHMRHHNVCPDKNFGFTSSIWDRVFGTYYKVKPKQ